MYILWDSITCSKFTINWRVAAPERNESHSDHVKNETFEHCMWNCSATLKQMKNICNNKEPEETEWKESVRVKLVLNTSCASEIF